MKCPKCAYLGFESGDRCRNCGYDFSLSASTTTTLDFTLDCESEPVRTALDLDRVIGAPEPSAPLDLPLFTPQQAVHEQRTDFSHQPPRIKAAEAEHRVGRRSSTDDDSPLITTPSHPRAPLGVRRATPEIPRARPRISKAPASPAENLFANSPVGALTPRFEISRAIAMTNEPPAAPARRILAAMVDVSLISVVDATVLYLTLRLCGLTTAEMFELPLLPLGAFFVLLNGGYFVAFTAVGGQSIGKMAAGIKVIADGDGSVPIGRATLRTLAYLISALPLGAGFLTGLVRADKLTLHDRLAHTRVVRPSHT